MADFDESVYQFLEAYKLMPSDDGRRTDSVITTILNDNKRDYEAWIKCPDWLKNKYSGKIPGDILSKAASSPNFTEAEAMRADSDHEKRNNDSGQEISGADSSVLDSLSQNPIYADLLNHGVKFSAAHVAIIKENTEIYKNGGYSDENAKKVAFEIAARKAIEDEIKAIQASNKPEEEKNALIQPLLSERQESRPRQAYAMRAELEYHPEKKLIRLIREVAKENVSKEEIASQMSKLIQTINAEGKLEKLATYMATPLYLAQANKSKDFFKNVLKENNVDLDYLDRIQQDQIIKNKIEALRTKIKPHDRAELSQRDKVMAARLGNNLSEYKTPGRISQKMKQDMVSIKDGQPNGLNVSKEYFNALIKRKTELEGQ